MYRVICKNEGVIGTFVNEVDANTLRNNHRIRTGHLVRVEPSALNLIINNSNKNLQRNNKILLSSKELAILLRRRRFYHIKFVK